MTKHAADVARQATDPPPCLLSYQFSTAPSPLQVSGQSQPSPGMVNAWISAPGGQTIYCSEIDVAVRVGTDPGEFSTVAPVLTPNTTWWVSAGAVMSDGRDFGLPQGNWAIFTVTCPSSDHWKIDYELIFSVTTTSVNPVPDTFEFVVVEYSALDNPDNIIQHKSTFTLQKSPVQLYLDNFVSVSASQAATIEPKTEFGAGVAIRLIWESNGTSFSLYADAGGKPIWTGPDTSYTVTGGAVKDTTFTLVAALAGVPDTSSAAVAVTITNPAATPRSDNAGTLTVTQTSTLTGEAQLASATVGQKLTVTGAARMAGVNAPSVTVTGQATLGSATLAGTTVNGAVGGNGSLTLASATVTAATVNNWLTALVPRAVSPGTTYAASSDGILTGTVWFPSDAGAQVATRISGTCSSIGTAYATGGNANNWVSKTEWMMWSSANSFSLPVPRGSTFSVGVDQRFGTGAPTAFAWFPLARNATLQELDLGPAAVPVPAGPEPVQFRRQSLRHQIDHIVRAVGEIFGDRLSSHRRERLTAALESLVRHGSQSPSHGESS